MAEITPKPATGVIVRFDPFPDSSTVNPKTPKPATGVIVRFSPLKLARGWRNLGLVRGARG